MYGLICLFSCPFFGESHDFRYSESPGRSMEEYAGAPHAWPPQNYVPSVVGNLPLNMPDVCFWI